MTEFNNVARLSYAPTKKLAELTINQDYMISNNKKVKTNKYWTKCVALIREKEQEYDMFFPKRICKLFKDNEKTYKQICDTAKESRLYCQRLGEGRLVFNIVDNEGGTNDEWWLLLVSLKIQR